MSSAFRVCCHRFDLNYVHYAVERYQNPRQVSCNLVPLCSRLEAIHPDNISLPSTYKIPFYHRLLFTADIEQKIPQLLEMVYPESWLSSPSTTNSSPSSPPLDDPTSPSYVPSSNTGLTNRDVQIPLYRYRMLNTRPQTPIGAISQMIAGMTHYVAPERLKHIAENVGKVVILTGDEDNLIRPENSFKIAEAMTAGELGRDGRTGVAKDGQIDVELVVWEKTGHALHMQWVQRFNELLERCWEEGTKNLASS